MPGPYGNILTDAGLISDGKITDAARKRYVDEVLALLVTGNADGKGGSPSTKIFNTLVPLPPIPGPTIFNVTTLSNEPLFWFGPDPLAAVMATLLRDPAKTPVWNAIFPDLLYAKTAEALDANGSTPLFPIFDVSSAFPEVHAFPISLPDLAILLGAKYTPVPLLLLKLAQIGISLSPPKIPLPPIPPDLPNFLPPAIPGIDLPGLPSLALIDLLLGLIKLPFDLIIKLVAPPDLGLALDLPGLPTKVLKIALDIVVDLLQPLIPIVPKLLIASILIYLKDVVAMVCTDIIGMIVGSGGVLTKTVAGLTGLV